MLGIGAVPSIFIAISVIFMPESPRWLCKKNRIEESKIILQKVGFDAKAADDEITLIKQSIETDDTNKKSNIFQLIMKEKWVRKVIIVGVGVALLQQATGNKKKISQLYLLFIFLIF